MLFVSCGMMHIVVLTLRGVKADGIIYTVTRLLIEEIKK